MDSSPFEFQIVIRSIVDIKILISDSYSLRDPNLNKTTCLNSRHKQLTKAVNRLQIIEITKTRYPAQTTYTDLEVLTIRKEHILQDLVNTQANSVKMLCYYATLKFHEIIKICKFSTAGINE